MSETKKYILDQLQKCLTYYGIHYRLRDDRAEAGPYISIGNNHFKKDRAQFWVGEKTNEIKVWIGINMRTMYSNGCHSEYREEWDTAKNNEIYLCFPELFLAIDFIQNNANYREK